MSQIGALRDLAGMIDVVERAAPKDGSYLERLFAAHERRLGQFLVHVVRDRALAEDLLQETFLAAWKARGELDAVENPEAWLFGIARHRALHALRGAQRLRRAVERLGAAAAPVDEGPALAIDTLALLHRVLGPEDRALVVLAHVHGFSGLELAEMTGRSHAAVRKRLERARTALLQEVER
jgi:RNA polymerase sigma-70 factor (ECF subfamily)